MRRRSLYDWLNIVVFGIMPAMALLALAVWGQQPTTPPEQLQQCQALIRVKTDMQTQAEQLAAVLLKRAEKAEADLAQLKAQAQAPLPDAPAPKE